MKADPLLCFVVDVFGGGVWSAGRTYRRAMRNVEAAAAEIVQVWASL